MVCVCGVCGVCGVRVCVCGVRVCARARVCVLYHGCVMVSLLNVCVLH